MIRLILALFLLSSLAACDAEISLEKRASEEPGIAARHYADLLQQKRLDELLDHFVPWLKTEITRAALMNTADLLPDTPAKKVRLIAYKRVDFRLYNLIFESEFPTGWVLTNIVVDRDDYAIISMNTQAVPQSVEETNRFTLIGKGALHYLFLGLMLASRGLIVVALIFAFWTPLWRRRWLWLLFISIGFGQASMNWTTGQLDFDLFSFDFLGARFMPPRIVGPWFLSVSLPLGAILFLLRRPKLLAAREAVACPHA